MRWIVFLHFINYCNLADQMYRDFIVKQTSDYPSEYKAKTLVGNWYEERCNPQRSDNFHFYKERKYAE